MTPGPGPTRRAPGPGKRVPFSAAGAGAGGRARRLTTARSARAMPAPRWRGDSGVAGQADDRDQHRRGHQHDDRGARAADGEGRGDGVRREQASNDLANRPPDSQCRQVHLIARFGVEHLSDRPSEQRQCERDGARQRDCSRGSWAGQSQELHQHERNHRGDQASAGDRATQAGAGQRAHPHRTRGAKPRARRATNSAGASWSATSTSTTTLRTPCCAVGSRTSTAPASTCQR